MKRLTLASVALVVALLATGASASGASTIYLCLAEKAGPAKSGGVEGKCPKSTEKTTYAKVALPKEESVQQTLLAILSHVKFVESGVGGKPTIQFSGVNVQIVNGEGKTEAVNGKGNLVIGYDENETKREQTGSHNLVLGDDHTFTSYGGIAGGDRSVILAPYASVTGGFGNLASGDYSSVSGGVENKAFGTYASVTAGSGNEARGTQSSITAGTENKATGIGASISGGFFNESSGEFAAILGGFDQHRSQQYGTIP